MELARRQGIPIFIVLALVLCLVELWVVGSPSFPAHSGLFGPVVTADLVLGLPLLFYGLVARPRRFSATTLLPVALLGFVLAEAIVPRASSASLDTLFLLVPLVELIFLGVFIWKSRGIYQDYRQARQRSIYFVDALESGIQARFGKNVAVTLLTLEFSLIFLSVCGWFMRFRGDPQQQVFTYHRKSRYPLIFLVFLLVIVVETVGLHLLLQRWSPLVAWVLTGLSIYSIFWMIGDFNALRLHPIVLTGDTLHLRSGLRWGANVPLAEIVAVQRPKPSDAKARDYLSFARAGEAQLVLVLAQPVRVAGLFGAHRQATRLGLYVDDLAAFRAAIQQPSRR